MLLLSLGAGLYLTRNIRNADNLTVAIVADTAFGWKFPVVKFPSTGVNDGLLAYSDIRDPGGISQGLPVRLKIASIGVDTAIEDALITPDGRMDVPLGSKNVAWFALGPHPGKEGSAVIGGHYGIRNGIPFVFYRLNMLKIGDKVAVVDDNDATIEFVVRSIKSFDRNADASSVFTSSDGKAHLNLITCEGVWNKVNDSYPLRLVVFTDAVTSESSTQSNDAYYRSLTVGSQGNDVIALQKVLETMGFLVMPHGVPMGYFGSLTRSAVIRFQKSTGLPMVGVFGPQTTEQLRSQTK